MASEQKTNELDEAKKAAEEEAIFIMAIQVVPPLYFVFFSSLFELLGQRMRLLWFGASVFILLRNLMPQDFTKLVEPSNPCHPILARMQNQREVLANWKVAASLAVVGDIFSRATAVGEAAEKEVDRPLYFVVIGNPGVGKSTILSGFFESSKCAFGHTTGAAKTTGVQKIQHPKKKNLFGYDLPGLGDPSKEKREQFYEYLREALNQSGSYQILFVIATHSNRLDKEIKEMVNGVLQNIPVEHDQFGVIINKIDPGSADYLDEENRAEFVKQLNELFKPHTAYIHFQEHTDGMSSHLLGKGNHPILTQKLVTFLWNLPVVHIDPEKVGRLEGESDARIRELEQEAKRREEEHKKDMEKLLLRNKELSLANAVKAAQRDPSVWLYTMMLVPLNLYATYSFLVYFSSSSADDADRVDFFGYAACLTIPVVLLFLAQLPSLVATKLEYMGMAEWLFKELAQRGLNIILDYTSLYDVCREVATSETSMVRHFIMWLLAATIVVEIVSCSTGYHGIATSFGVELLKVLDFVQLLLTCAIYFIDVTVVGFCAGLLKAIFQLAQVYFD